MFRSFWLERPAPGADTIVIHALLDSPSTTAAKIELICFQMSRNVSLVSISKSSGWPGRS